MAPSRKMSPCTEFAFALLFIPVMLPILLFAFIRNTIYDALGKRIY